METTMQRHKRQSGWGYDDAAWLTSFLVLVGSFWMVYQYQCLSLPAPLSPEEAGISGFSEIEAMKHIKALTDLGPHPVGSDALDVALKYALETAEKIKQSAPEDVVVDVDFFKPKIGSNSGSSGRLEGVSVVYSGLKHVILRIYPKNSPEAAENAVLVSAHIDTVFSGEGAADDVQSIGTMLELARAISHSSYGFKNAVVFLFNSGEEDGLLGSYSFVTQHPWNHTLRIAIDLEAQGIGGKSGIIQAGPDPFALHVFSSSAKYPCGNVLFQDVFSSGVISSSTDFQIYVQAGMSGLDFAFTDKTHVYHTKNDKFELFTPGSTQHLGENMLGFLIQIASSSVLSKEKAMKEDNADYDPPIYYDILGAYMIVYHQSFAKILHEVVIVLFLGILAAPIVSGGYPAAISLGLSTLGTVLMVLFSILFSVPVAFILPQICSSPVPYIASPWLVIGLFAAPALLGALAGQHLGCIIIKIYLLSLYPPKKFSFDVHDDEINLEAERLLFKGGSVLWLVLLILGTHYEVGSAYIALFWLVPPAFTYYLREATPATARLHLPSKFATLLVGLAVPVLITGGLFIRAPLYMIGNLTRSDSVPGSNREWLGSVEVAVLISVLVCLSLVYLLSYVHFTGAMWWVVVLGTIALFGLSIFFVSTGIVPPFTDDTARAVNVVHVVDTTGSNGGTQKPISYLNLFATTPGKLTKEAELINEGFECGRDKVVDFVTFKVHYGCWSYSGSNGGWNDSDIPTLRVDSHTAEYGTQEGITSISIDAKNSVRWALGINLKEVKDFLLKANSEVVIPKDGEKSNLNGWHTVRFTGFKGAQTNFELVLFPKEESVRSARLVDDQLPLLKLRTDLERTTPAVEAVEAKFPAWCSFYGKSTNPRTLAFLSGLPVSSLATWNKTALASS